MPSFQSLVVLCPNLGCGDERWDTTGPKPMVVRCHRRMEYMGCNHVGFIKYAFKRIFKSNEPLGRGLYHFYECTVCGRAASYIEKWRVLRRVP
jgi:hypothetical protein